MSATPHLHFPPYTKSQFTAILSVTPPPPLPNTTQQETTELYSRFGAAVHDSLTRPASRTLPSLRQAAGTLWPRFTAPVAAGTHKAREFSKLLVAARVWLQDESVLAPGIVFCSSSSRAPASSNPNTKSATSSSTTTATLPPSRNAATTPTGTPRKAPPTPGSAAKRGQSASAALNAATTDLTALLPPTAKLLLVAAYLASHNTPRHDQTLFSTWHHAGRRRRGGGLVLHHRGPRPKHRKIARKLLGPGVFVLERMVAIYVALRREHGGRDLADGGGGAAGVDADIAMAIATLASLRLLMKVGGAAAAAGGAGAGDMDRGGRWRVGVGWEVVRGVGRSIGLEVEEWLVE
jgi:origin recognition complex subunit 5